MKQRGITALLLTVSLLLGLAAGIAQAQHAGPGPAALASPVGSAFTYQGRLMQDGQPVNGACDLRFRLFDAASGGSQVGPTVTKAETMVTDGLVSVTLDFGADAFQGDARWLEVAVRCPAGSGGYTVLSPRQPITPAPYALFSLAAPWSGITDMPAGFADGVDDDTRYSAGTGLALVGNQFRLQTSYRLPQGCSNGQVAKWNGTAWTCGDFWSLTGNGGTDPNTNFLGTTDNQALEIRVNGQRALRIEPKSYSPNIIGGYSSNSVADSVVGATISGGGSSNQPNQVSGDYATVGGGSGNTASDDYATVGGGSGNEASGEGAFVGGGGAYYGFWGWLLGPNIASGGVAVVAGGYNNTASGFAATVPGGYDNEAKGDHSFAAGRRAKADHDGAFVWADTQNTDFTSDRADQFKVRARGGVKFVVQSSGLNPAGVKIEQQSSNGVGLYIRQESSDAALVATNTGSGDLIKAFSGSSGGNLRFRVDNAGNVTADGAIHGGGADFAELLPAAEGLEPGDVLVVGPDGKLDRSSEPYATNVVGVYSTHPGFVGGSDEDGVDPGKAPLAIVGVVPVKASAENGPIIPGDLLVASSTPGYAMKADANPPVGAVIGKALEALDEGVGVIQMLVMLQ